MINAEVFNKLKKKIIIINTARGGVIDEDALIQAIDSGKILGAGLDVFENEPNPKKEIAEHLGISIGGAGTRLFRARQQLREMLVTDS